VAVGIPICALEVFVNAIISLREPIGENMNIHPTRVSLAMPGASQVRALLRVLRLISGV
jgi:hypothetical protein